MIKLSTTDFIEKAIKIHGSYYDYSNVEYVHSLEYVSVLCPKHGAFRIRPSNHINNKQGCLECGREQGSKKQTTTLEDFLSKIKTKQNNVGYNFDDVIQFKNNRSKITIECLKHGKYETTPRSALESKFFGCSSCRHQGGIKGEDDFIMSCKNTHGNRYTYKNTKYIKSHENITVTCQDHGDFETKAYIHISGKGQCPNCTPFVSSYEIELQNYIKNIGINDIRTSVRNIEGIKEIDIICDSNKLAIEFDGLYWHSDLFKEKNYHLDKTNKMQGLGYTLIHIFEDEWIHKKEICKSIIASKLGKSEKIYARKCELKVISNVEARNFLNTHHLQGSVNSKVKIGLFYNSKLVSVSTFGNLRLALGSSSKTGEWELYRHATHMGYVVVGGFSKIMAFFEKTYKPSKIITYSDRRWFDGGGYFKNGFEFKGSTPPNYFYVKGLKRINRFNFTKYKLVKLGENPNSTEKNIMKSKGYHRIYDCGCNKYEKTLI